MGKGKWSVRVLIGDDDGVVRDFSRKPKLADVLEVIKEGDIDVDDPGLKVTVESLGSPTKYDAIKAITNRDYIFDNEGICSAFYDAYGQPAAAPVEQEEQPQEQSQMPDREAIKAPETSNRYAILSRRRRRR